MAMADYYLCDVCEGKCFYDSNLNWEHSTKSNPIPEDQWLRGFPGLKLDRCGDMVCICNECAKTHQCVVVPLTNECKELAVEAWNNASRGNWNDQAT